MARDILSNILLLENIPPVDLSVTTGVGGFWWTIYLRDFKSDPPHWQFENIPPSSDSIAMEMTLFIVVHLMWIGPFSGG